jgi:hypothetical protein
MSLVVGDLFRNSAVVASESLLGSSSRAAGSPPEASMNDKPLLMHVDLVSDGAGERGGTGTRQVLAGITISPPLLYRAGPEDVPVPIRRRLQDGRAQVVGLVCAVELDRPTGGQTYGPLHLEVTLPGECRIVAFPDLPSDNQGLYGSRISRTFTDTARGHSVVVHAIVEAAAGQLELDVELSCQVEVRRSVGRRVHVLRAVLDRGVRLTERIPTGEAGTIPSGGRAVRLAVSLDMQAYGDLDPGASERAQGRLAKVTDRARDATGAAVEDRQEAGDGLMFVFPPGIDENAVLRAFYAELAAGLREVNVDLNEVAAVRLRVGVERGLTMRGGTGWTGPGPVAAALLRDCEDARTALAAAPTSPFVLTASDSLYRDVFSERGREPAAESFTRTDVSIPEKRFAATAWIHVADGAG